jgi:hypothetical protein
MASHLLDNALPQINPKRALHRYSFPASLSITLLLVAASPSASGADVADQEHHQTHLAFLKDKDVFQSIGVVNDVPQNDDPSVKQMAVIDGLSGRRDAMRSAM